MTLALYFLKHVRGNTDMNDTPTIYPPEQLLGSRVVAIWQDQAIPTECMVLEISADHIKLQKVYGGEDPFWRASSGVDIKVLLPKVTNTSGDYIKEWLMKQGLPAHMPMANNTGVCRTLFDLLLLYQCDISNLSATAPQDKIQ